MGWLIGAILFLALGIYLLIIKKDYVGKSMVRGEVIGLTPEVNIVRLRYKPLRSSDYVEADLLISAEAADFVFGMLYVGKVVRVVYADSDPNTPLEMTLSSNQKRGTFFEAAYRLSFVVAGVCLVMFIFSII